MKFPGLGFIANLKRRAEEREVLNFYGRKVFLSSKRFLKKEKRTKLDGIYEFCVPLIPGNSLTLSLPLSTVSNCII